MNHRITASYIRDLTAVYHKIDNRGLLFDEHIMSRLDYDIGNKITSLLQELSFSWGETVFIGADKNKKGVNLNSSQQLLAKLKDLKYNIPKVRKKNEETYEVEFKESVEELVLRKIFAETGSADINKILDIKELNTLKTRFINSTRVCGAFYSCYNPSGTTTGRRGCKKHTFNCGGNAQTLPKHYGPTSACSDFGKQFLSGVISRPGNLFFSVDQISAEDWPTSALAENHVALDELRNKVDRHTNLASFIFNIPVGSRTVSVWKDSIERYLGKKSRHAFNYGMRGATMADALAKEGFSYSAKSCQEILNKVDEYDPSVDRVFHKYIRDTIFRTQTLSTPFERERHFLGLRQNDPNYKIFNEAYSYIPQSVVGDNTGFAVFELERTGSNIVLECHDSVNQEIRNDLGTVCRTYERTRSAFDRDIRFHNGITINIPIEGELGYNLRDTVKIKEFTEENVIKAYKELKEKYKPNGEETEESVVAAL